VIIVVFALLSLTFYNKFSDFHRKYVKFMEEYEEGFTKLLQKFES